MSAGPLVVCKPGALQGSNSRQDVDASFVLLFEVIDENESWYLDDNIRMFGNSASKSTPDFKESNLMHGKLLLGRERGGGEVRGDGGEERERETERDREGRERQTDKQTNRRTERAGVMCLGTDKQTNKKACADPPAILVYYIHDQQRSDSFVFLQPPTATSTATTPRW